MSYQVLARKWRPRVFADVIGQEHALRALRNALKRERLHHAYLFTGTRGVGKTTLARIVAKCLCCAQGRVEEPCGKCTACKDIDAGRYPDLIEVDAASRAKVEETRELMQNVPYAPTAGSCKVYLIDEVHMFSGHSFNALLKTLEEPPEHVQFLFATTEPQRLPVTILSRCLQLHLRRLGVEHITKRLEHITMQEQVEADPAALELLAKAADGSLRDALSLLDRAISDGDGRLSQDQVHTMLGTVESGALEKLLTAIKQRDGQALLRQMEEVALQTPDYKALLAEILQLLQRTALVQATGGKPTAEWERAQHWSKQLNPEDVQVLYEIALHARRDLDYAPDPRTGFEMCLIRMLDFYPAHQAPKAGTETPLPEATPPRAAPGQVQAREQQHQAKEQHQPPVQAPKQQPPGQETNDNLAQWWKKLVPNLGIGGLANQTARHCFPIYRNETGLTLGLDPQHASLISGDAHDNKVWKELETAVSKHMGRKYKLTLKQETIEGETAAEQHKRQQREKREEAEKLLQNDKCVQDIKELFDARLDSNSIEPTPTTGP